MHVLVLLRSAYPAPARLPEYTPWLAVRAGSDDPDETGTGKRGKKNPDEMTPVELSTADAHKSQRLLGGITNMLLKIKTQVKNDKTSKAILAEIKEFYKTGETLRKDFATELAKGDQAEVKELKKIIKAFEKFKEKAEPSIKKGKAFLPSK